MRRRNARAGSALIGMLLLAACSDTLPTAPDAQSRSAIGISQSGQATSYSGRATAVTANVVLVGAVRLADTGPLPSSGGQAEATLVEAGVPGLVSATALHSTTIGQGDRAASESSLANLSLTLAGNTVSASFVGASAEAACNEDGSATVTGSSEIADLTINGQSIPVTGAPNQEVELPGGARVIINEQRNTTSGNTGDLTVNALHVIVPAVGDVVIASAHADISCSEAVNCAQVGDFVTGGGWIETSGARANFGVGGGIKQSGFWGHLTYIDHGANLKVKGLGVDGYVVVDDRTRIIRGPAQVNGSPDRYEVTVTDNDEPGRTVDRFNIVLLSGYTAGKELDGGNIQLHGKPTECDGGGGGDPF